MRADSEALLRPPAGAGEAGGGWMVAASALAVLTAWLFVWYGETAGSIVSTWWRSETYAHGFLIVPISAWLIWRRRSEVLALPPRPDPRGFVLLAGAGFVWLVAEVSGVLVAQQYALTAMLPLIAWTLLGWRVAAALAFPLAFLLFAVPFGEMFLPPMMRFTADFTVTALQITGIPVYREGLYFQVPSGSWSVVEACSGLRYLIASLTLGCLYAYLTYRSLKRRLLFILLSLSLPVLANGVRAYLIVMIGHLSDMRLATGIDHYIYGWVFFGLVMLLLFWVGSFWREDLDAAPASPVVAADAPGQPLRVVAAAAVAAVLLAVWPAYARLLETRAGTAVVTLDAPDVVGWASGAALPLGWRPHFRNPRREVSAAYGRGERPVGLYLAYYYDQHQGSELISFVNAISPTRDKRWGNVGEGERELPVPGGEPLALHETRLRGAGRHLLAWHWYWVDGHATADPLVAKLLGAKARLLGQGDDAAVVVVYAVYDEDPEEAAAPLRQFLQDALPQLQRRLSDARRS